MGPEHKRWLELIYEASNGTSKNVPYRPIRTQIEEEFPESDIDQVFHWLTTEQLMVYSNDMPLFFYMDDWPKIEREEVKLTPKAFDMLESNKTMHIINNGGQVHTGSGNNVTQSTDKSLLDYFFSWQGVLGTLASVAGFYVFGWKEWGWPLFGL